MLTYTTKQAEEYPSAWQVRFNQLRAEEFYDLAAMLQIEGEWSHGARREPQTSTRFLRLTPSSRVSP